MIDRALGWLFDRVMAGPLERFRRAVADPAEAQRRALRRILAANRDTAFGREHGFASLAALPDGELWTAFRRAVPIRPYAGFAPAIERMKAGEPDVLIPGLPEMFSLTSGTTAEPKFCPVNRAFIREHHRQHLIWMYHAYRDRPRVNSGSYLTLTSPAEMGRTAGGIPYGAMSGKQLAVQSIPVRRRMAAPGGIQTLPDAADRWFNFVLFGLARPGVTVVTAVNPTSLVMIARTLADRADELLHALAHGHAAPEVAGRFRADPRRAAALGEAARAAGGLTPALAWPELATLFTWQGGAAGFHLPRVRELWGAVPMRCLGLRASEGTFSIPLRDDDPSGVLAVDGHALEFVPAEDGDPAEDAATLLGHELEEGRLYRLIASTSAGLCRYDMGDLVRVTGFCGATPEVAFERRAGAVLSATGEKVTEDQVVRAMAAALWGGLGLAGFTVTWELAGDRVRYVAAVEPAADAAPGWVEGVVAGFDRELARVNCEYGAKREDGRIVSPRAVVVRAGAYDVLRARAAAAGRPESQVKQVHVAQPGGESGVFAEEFRL